MREVVDWVLTGGWMRFLILCIILILIIVGPICLAVYVDRCYEVSARASVTDLASAIAAAGENLVRYRGPYAALAREQLDRATELYKEAIGDIEIENWVWADKTARTGLTIVEAVNALTSKNGGIE